MPPTRDPARPDFRDSLPPPIQSVFHASDLSPKSALAFVHALKIALVRKTRLEIMHLGDKGGEWHEFPAVRGTLERWGVLEPGSSRRSVQVEAGIDVTKVSSKRRRAVGSIVAYLEEHPADMLVLATSGRTGLQALLQPSFAERLVRRVRTGTLFVTEGARGFVDPEDGSVRLRRVLAFADQPALAQPVVDMVGRLFQTVGTPPEKLLLGHTVEPQVKLPGDGTWPWERRAVAAPVADNALSAAREIDADLIVTAAHARLSPAAWLFGSTTERIVRRAPCPVLLIPPV
jgi:nucleotide-binding universal stress UspA family protein